MKTKNKKPKRIKWYKKHVMCSALALVMIEDEGNMFFDRIVYKEEKGDKEKEGRGGKTERPLESECIDQGNKK